MYAHIRGTLCEANTLDVVIEAAGIGYKLFIPINLIGQLPSIGAEIKLFTSFVIRENMQTLYGFTEATQRDLFELLLNVSGIGPKTALSLIGHLSVADFKRAIAFADIPTLRRVPGIGKKTAERLLLEMRDKADKFAENTPQEFAASTLNSSQARNVQDAISALINLGYNQATAQKAIKKAVNDLSDNADVAALITASLRNV